MALELRDVTKTLGAETHIYPTSLKFEAQRATSSS